tara:strand:- start:58 stop:603 length:546 start_codon:yes stop_codon:yes gene_type:complete
MVKTSSTFRNFLTFIFLLISFSLIFLGLGCNYFYSVDIGKKAPDFKLSVFKNNNYNFGHQVTLSDFIGTPVVINFYYPSCPPCRVEMPDLEDISNEYVGQLQVIGVQQLGIDSPEDGQNFVDQLGLTFLLGADKDNGIMKKYEIVGFPTTIILDKNHKINKVWVGYIGKDQLIKIIEDVLD